MDSRFFQQYKATKEKHADAIVLMQINEDYFAFDEDAETISKELGLVTTKRNEQTIAFVYNSNLSLSISKLVRAGYKVAIIEKIKKDEKDNNKTSS